MKQQLLFCEKYNINPSELLLLEIILIAKNGDGPEIVYEYFSSRARARGATSKLLSGLRDSGIIHKTYEIPDKRNINSKKDLMNMLLDIPLNKNITKDFYRYSFELGKELWDTYPQFGIVNNSQVGLKSISKKFDTIEDFYRFYGRTIRWKPEIHNQIIELVKWAGEHNILCTTIANFVIDHKWEELEALKDKGGVNYDSMRLL